MRGSGWLGWVGRGRRWRRLSLATGLVAGLVLAGPALADSRWTDNYQVDAAHSGRMWNAGVLPPLHYAWTAPITAANYSILYPVLRGNDAYVVDKKLDVLRAISLATGQTVWQRSLAFYKPVTGDGPYLAADEGEVFVTANAIKPGTSDILVTLVQAFNSVTGAPLWSAYPVGDTPAQPISSGGVLYLDSTDVGGNRAAVRESDGKVLWDVNNGAAPSYETYSGGFLTLSPSGLIGHDSCGGGVDSDVATGQQIWNAVGSCSGPDGLVGVSAGPGVWFGYPDGGVAGLPGTTPNVVLDPATGRQLGTFPAGLAPVFADGLGIQNRAVMLSSSQVGGDLSAWNPATGTTTWTFTDSGRHDVATMPLAADGYVFAASGTGTVWELNPTTGAVVWSWQPTTATTVYYYTGLAAGNGSLVLLTHSGLIGFHGSGAPTGGPPASWTAPPSLPH